MVYSAWRRGTRTVGSPASAARDALGRSRLAREVELERDQGGDLVDDAADVEAAHQAAGEARDDAQARAGRRARGAPPRGTAPSRRPACRRAARRGAPAPATRRRAASRRRARTPSSSGRPSSCSIQRRTSANGRGGTASWKRPRRRMNGSAKTSARAPTIWQSFTKKPARWMPRSCRPRAVRSWTRSQVVRRRRPAEALAQQRASGR